MKLMALPVEILTHILHYVHDDDPEHPIFFCPDDAYENARSLHACCLVNHFWHAQGIQILYSKFRYREDENTFAKLWHFLRTVVEKPELGAFVKRLDLRERYQLTSKRAEEVSHQQRRMRRREIKAFHAIGIRLGLRNLAEALHLQECSPFIAILIACLPNVSKLILSLDYGSVRHNVRYFTKPLLQALDEDKVLQQLSEARLFHPRKMNEEVFHYGSSHSMKGIPKFCLRPSIRKLEAFDLNPGFLQLVSDELPLGKSGVTHLTLTTGLDNQPFFNLFNSTSVDNGALKACLQLPRALVSLTLHVKGHIYPVREMNPNHLIAHDEVWQLICVHNHSLKYLDLYDEYVLYPQHNRGFNLKAPMSKVNEFHCLTTLRIQPELVLGGTNGLLKAPYRLRDALPPRLKSLTLYNFGYPGESLINGKDLQTELLQILSYTTIFDSLRFLLIQDTYKNSLPYAAQGEELLSKLTALHQACSDRQIIFRIMSFNHLPQGGYNLLKHPEAHKPEARALDAWKRGIDGLRGDTPELKRAFVLE